MDRSLGDVVRKRLSKAASVDAVAKIARMRPVPGPRRSLGNLDAAAAATLISTAADVAVILDSGGNVMDVSFGSEEMAKEGFSKWIDQPWIDTVTADSRSRVESLLRDSTTPEQHKWRHINHSSSRGADVPVLYSAVKLGADGHIVAFGRDLREMASLQQRLVDAQQSMERDYWRLRNVEARYRVLFQMSSEAILIVDAASEKIVEANPSAADLFGDSSKRLVGRVAAECFGPDAAQALQALLAGVRVSGRADDVAVRVGIERRDYAVSAFYFRQGNEALYLLRIAVPRAEGASAALPRSVLRAVENAADAFVTTDLDGRLMTANRAFLDLAQVPTETQVRSEMLDRWIGRSRVDFGVLMANLRQHGTIRMFATALTGEHDAIAEVEISAVAIPLADPPCMAFNIRNVGRRVSSESVESDGEVPRSVEQLTELVGRVPLKELVREATDLVEKLCIEAALQLTRDNRASAAEMLGVSRQSLYVKLRRYGLIDATAATEESGDE